MLHTVSWCFYEYIFFMVNLCTHHTHFAKMQNTLRQMFDGEDVCATQPLSPFHKHRASIIFFTHKAQKPI